MFPAIPVDTPVRQRLTFHEVHRTKKTLLCAQCFIGHTQRGVQSTLFDTILGKLCRRIPSIDINYTIFFVDLDKISTSSSSLDSYCVHKCI